MKNKLQKSPQAFRTISEVSEELKLPNHVLRFWETKFSQVQPLKRSGGRRYYRPKDIELLFEIKNLLYENGYTLKGVKKILSQHKSIRHEKTTVVESPQILENNDDKDQIPFNFKNFSDQSKDSKLKIKKELMDILSDLDNLISKY